LRHRVARINAAKVKRPAVYIMASGRNGTLYTGVTSGLVHRAWQHREGIDDGFTKKYGCKILVWYALHPSMPEAIAREKQIKAGKRSDKLKLIESMNPQWRDLFDDIAHS
jgi:predicted GIY-YIG superfamily endonuclease